MYQGIGSRVIVCCVVLKVSCWYLDSVELQVEAVNGLEALAGLDVLGIPQHADVDRDLEVVLLLAHKGVIRQGEVEALVCVHAIGGHRPGGETMRI